MPVRIKNDPEVSIKINKDRRKADVDHKWSGIGQDQGVIRDNNCKDQDEINENIKFLVFGVRPC